MCNNFPLSGEVEEFLEMPKASPFSYKITSAAPLLKFTQWSPDHLEAEETKGLAIFLKPLSSEKLSFR